MERKRKEFWIVFFIVAVVVCLSVRADAAIVPGNYYPETLTKDLWFENYDFISESPRGNERENSKGYNFVMGERECWDWIDKGYYNWIDKGYYAALDKGLFCYWWDGWSYQGGWLSFYMDNLREMQIYYRPSELLDPRFYGFAAIVGERGYYSWLDRGYYSWLDRGYYRSLDRGFFLHPPVGYLIPEPATIGLLGLGLLFVFLLRKRKHQHHGQC